ncbi:hypothetical protein D3C72_1032290 [compost metagenome]
MIETKYIASLHRPFNQQLKTSKWVCSFIASLKKPISSSQLLPQFYYYLIVILEKEYKKERPSTFNGLPSDLAVNNIYHYIHKSTQKTNFLIELPSFIRSRNTALDKQIYSTYKAASYYLNLAKDKFGLINIKNELTEKGKELLKIKSNFFNISSKEAEFYFKRILEADFHLFITHCLFLKLAQKYKLKSFISEQAEFITKYLEIKHFNFTSASLSNYCIVRNSWVESLDIIDANKNIRKKYMEIVAKNVHYLIWFEKLKGQLKTFENESFKARTVYVKRKAEFLNLYKESLGNSKNDLDFINLHDLKREMRISTDNFQKFLVEFYESEKSSKNIFFSNIVNSIDTRTRFYIRSRPVIKIKIKDK